MKQWPGISCTAWEIDPNLARLHCNLANALAELENHADAIRCYGDGAPPLTQIIRRRTRA